MSLTEDIYQELIEALEQGLDCGEVIAKYSGVVKGQPTTPLDEP